MLIATMIPGCETAPRDVPEPVVARAGDRAFTAEALARLLVLAQPLPLDASIAEELSRHWLGLTLVTERWAGGDSLLSATDADVALAFAMRDSALAAYRWQQFPDFEERVKRRTTAASRATEPRLIAHVLRRAGPESRPEERELQRRTAERLLAGLRSGRPWAWANAENEDATSRSTGGMIGLVQRGELPPPLDAAAYALEVGSYSDVTESSYGFHILYRPPPTEIWLDRLRTLVAERVAAEIDSVLLSVARAKDGTAIAPGATATARSIARDPWRAAGRRDTLARVGEAVLTAGEFVGFAVILPAETRRGLATAPEEDVGWYVRTTAEREALWHLADAAGVRAPPDAAEALRSTYRTDMRALAKDVAAAASTSDMSLSVSEQRTMASRRVMQALEGIAARRVDMRPVPPLLMLRLLEQSDWSFDASAIDPALRRARVLIDASRPGRQNTSS